DLATRAAHALAETGVQPCYWLSPDAPPNLPQGWRHLADPGRGPLAALAVALEALVDTQAEAVLLLAADLPLIHSPHLLRLLKAWKQVPGRILPLCAADGGGRPQPVCAIYPKRLLPQIQQQLAEGPQALLALLKQGRQGVTTPAEVMVYMTEADEGRDTIHPCFNLNQLCDWEQLRHWSKEGKLP
ncbi:MAG: NTP transferase domain-containing protein, partial [Planctomycetes bacterium]|nr:NTP transferase domain-containing protein [Planctomycetota bacterium]